MLRFREALFLLETIKSLDESVHTRTYVYVTGKRKEKTLEQRDVASAKLPDKGEGTGEDDKR